MTGHRGKARLSANEEYLYVVPLARGASHIASCLSTESRRNAIAEIADDFVRHHGKAAQEKFLFALAGKLDDRGNPEAAFAVRHLAQHGVLPALGSDAQESQRRARQPKTPADDSVADATCKRRQRRASAEPLAA